MAERSESLIPILAACASGVIGISAFLAGFGWLGWVGASGFVLLVVWMIFTQPDQKGKGDGVSMMMVGDGRGGDTAGGDAGVSGGDGGGGG
ncbi:hypothetical protein [Roseovarius sp. 2305UL8-3]|uniref:hypothetical protein n=1 Tax=Roseovarius conchicola TaxID=3121636 RepID=UPI00352713E2